jgi:glycosyltransferase involved in cell wall biosynthesis
VNPTNGSAPSGTRVALVHDHFTQRGGAERVAEHLAGLYPGAALYTSVVDPAVVPTSVAPARIRTSRLQRVRDAGVPLSAMAPLLHGAFVALDVGTPAVVISSSSSFAHHVRPPEGTVHVCYCESPPRFLWESADYFAERVAVTRVAAPALPVLRRWDRDAAARVHLYVANSRYTAARIWRTYRRRAPVVHPPVDTSAFAPSDERSGRFLVVARLRRYKALDRVVAAANAHRLPLDVIGEGPDRARLEELAGPTVRFLGWLDDADVADAMARCVALVVPGVEDFGLTMAEVQAAGRPPIAFAAGGALDIVRDGESGFLVASPTAAAVANAMRRALDEELDRRALVASARRFDRSVFDGAIDGIVERVCGGRRAVAVAAAR